MFLATNHNLRPGKAASAACCPPLSSATICQNLSPECRQEIAAKAGLARWNAKEEHRLAVMPNEWFLSMLHAYRAARKKGCNKFQCCVNSLAARYCAAGMSETDAERIITQTHAGKSYESHEASTGVIKARGAIQTLKRLGVWPHCNRSSTA